MDQRPRCFDAVKVRYLIIRERFASFRPCRVKKGFGCHRGVVYREDWEPRTGQHEGERPIWILGPIRTNPNGLVRAVNALFCWRDDIPE